VKILPVCAFGCLLALPLTAAAISIDEFSENVALSTGSSYTDGGMVGGERDALVSGNPPPSFVVAGGLATFSATGPVISGPVITQFLYDGNDNSSTNIYGLTGVDLTTGNHDRFLVAVTAVNGPLTLVIRVWESGTAYSSLQLTDVVAPGVYEFEFALFQNFGAGADFTDPGSIGLFVQGINDLGGDTPNPRNITIDYIRTAPNPLLFEDGFENP